MDKHIIYAIIGTILLILIPLVPQMVRVRIAVLRFLRLGKVADWHQNALKPIVIVVRIVLLCLAAYMYFIAFGG